MYKKIVLATCLITIAWLCAMDNNDLKKMKDFAKEDEQAGRLFRNSVFYNLMQKSEDDFVKNADKYGGINSLDLKQYKGRFRKNAVDAIKSPFTLETIGELKKKFSNYKKNNPPAVQPGEIKILNAFDIWAKKGLMEALRETDIRYLQEVNPGAVFQLASNFNSLEGGVGTGTLSHMIRSPVQGENAVLGTMGGGFIRRYLVRPQDRNLLRYTNAETDLNGIVRNKIDFNDSDIDNIAIGYHANVVVTSGYYPPFVRTSTDTLEDIGGAQNQKQVSKDYVDSAEKGVKESNKKYFDDVKVRDRIEFLFSSKAIGNNRNPIFVFNSLLDDSVTVDQVITSALNICGSKTDSTKSAKIILNAMYVGTILSAAVRGKKKLFITMVGAGAFCNEPKWIMEALDQPLIKEAIAYTGMEVILVIYPDIRKGRGLDEKPYDSKGTSQEQKNGSALIEITATINAINNEIKTGIKKNVPSVDPVTTLGFSLRSKM